MRRSGHLMVGVVALALLTGCVGGEPAPTTSPTTAPTVDPVAWPDCDAFAAVVDASGVLPGPLTGVLAEPAAHPAPLGLLNPTESTLLDAGGLACTALEVAPTKVLALPGAGADFAEALAAVGAAQAETPGESDLYVASDLGDGGVSTCRDTGGTGLCTWSLVADDVWYVIEFSPFDLSLLVFPPDLPSGWAQPAYPVPGGALEALVTELIATAAASVPEVLPTVAASATCDALTTPERLTAALGEAAVDQRIAPVTPAQVAGSVISTAGYSLPYYAAERAGWSRCTGASLSGDAQLTVVVRPRASAPAAQLDPGQCGPAGEVDGEACLVGAVIDGELRVAQLLAPAGRTTPVALRALVD